MKSGAGRSGKGNEATSGTATGGSRRRRPSAPSPKTCQSSYFGPRETGHEVDAYANRISHVQEIIGGCPVANGGFCPDHHPRQSTLVITANRVEQPISSVLAPVVVIDRAEIESRQVQSLPALLKTLPGVQITTLGGRGHMSSLFIRGTNSNHSLVLMNGRPIAAMVAGTPDLSQIPLGNIERIEYIRGPRAAVYGSDAIGGVINLITKTSARMAARPTLRAV